MRNIRYVDDGEQEIYEALLKDDNLRCTCDEAIREESFNQAQGHYHHCMLYQVTQAIRLSLKLFSKFKKQLEYATGYTARTLRSVQPMKKENWNESFNWFFSKMKGKLQANISEKGE